MSNIIALANQKGGADKTIKPFVFFKVGGFLL